MIDLDKRILDGKKPLTAFDEVDSKFIGTECYFSDDASDFMNVVLNCQKGRLLSIGEITGLFKATIKNSYEVLHYCLPAEWVKTEPEKKYRPYTLNEFVSEFSLGDEIILRPKSDGIICHKLFVEYAEYDDGDDTVFLGSSCYGLTDLYEDCEIYTGKEWQPFGVLDE